MRNAILGLVLLMASALSAPLHADFSVHNAEPFVLDRVIHVNTRFDFALNSKTEEALNKGIPLDVVVDIALVRQRWWWANKVITDVTVRRRISFHALSRQYLVTGLYASDPTESFGLLNQALAHMGDFTELLLPLTPKKKIEPDESYALAMRARLDIESLPTLMRPLAYVTPSWRLGTGWKLWSVQP